MSTPIAPLDGEAAHLFWNDYAAARPGWATADRAAPDDLVVDHFGDSAELADHLLELVLHGPKRATASLVVEYVAEESPLPGIGGHWIACDGRGAPRAILRTTGLRLGPVDSVDDAFARDEGEDDRTRDSWLREHRRYWTRVCAAQDLPFDDSSEVVFERFRVVWPPEHADDELAADPADPAPAP
jgi:uncharacterized protein YhfF